MLVANAEFVDLTDLAAHRQARWERQREYVMATSPLHARAWGAVLPPTTLAGLEDLPFTDKEMLRESQSNHPPFGDYLAAPLEAISRVHRTSGTTGTAMNLALSARDAHETAVVGARSQAASGLGPGHRVVHCLNYRMWMGGVTDHMTLEATGATVVPFGVGETRLLIRTVMEVGITAISCTPSYPAVLERVIAEDFPDLRPVDLKLQLALFGGEAGVDDPEFRRRLESVWGFKVRNANYGVSDVFSNFAGQCEQDIDLHFIALDVLHPELVVPGTGASLPWREGETGELVLTHLSRAGQPLVRFVLGADRSTDEHRAQRAQLARPAGALQHRPLRRDQLPLVAALELVLEGPHDVHVGVAGTASPATFALLEQRIDVRPIRVVWAFGDSFRHRRTIRASLLPPRASYRATHCAVAPSRARPVPGAKPTRFAAFGRMDRRDGGFGLGRPFQRLIGPDTGIPAVCGRSNG